MKWFGALFAFGLIMLRSEANEMTQSAETASKPYCIRQRNIWSHPEVPFVDERKSEQMKLKEQTSTDKLSTRKVSRRIEKIRDNWSTTQRRERARRAVELQLTLLAQAVFGRGQAGT